MSSEASNDRPVRGEAGPVGDSVRSDLFVAFTPQPAGLKITLRSRVAPYYGDQIRAQAEQVLDQLGVTAGDLEIDDRGALPFVIAARIEAAVRAAGLGTGRRARPDAVARPEASARNRLRRSRLYLPGGQPKLFINAGLHGADGVILDLEDSVHPHDKAAARVVVRNALRAVDFNAAERMVRINQLPLGLADLDEIVPEAPDLILIPKVEHPDQVRAVAARVDAIEGEIARPAPRPVWLMPILESALGIERAFDIARATERVAALTLGLEDLTADLGVPKTRTGEETLYARSRVVNAARAAGVQAIDSVYGDVGDADGLAQWGRRSRALGFEGMGCVHPRQIPVIHEAFAPSPKEIDRALAVVAAYERATASGLGVVSLGSKMIDPPVVNRALDLVARARSMGLVNAETAERTAQTRGRQS